MLEDDTSKKSVQSVDRASRTPARQTQRIDSDAMEPSLRLIASRVKRWREEAGMTLKELADQACVSPSTVHKVENGQVSPTVSVLLRIAHGLEKPPEELISLEEDDNRDYLVSRRRDRIVVRDTDGTFVEKAAADLDNSQIDLWRATIQPGATSPAAIRQESGEVILYCDQGRLTVWLGEEELQLEAGDSVHCRAWVARRWENRSSDPVSLTIAVTIAPKTRARHQNGINSMWKHTVDDLVEDRRTARVLGIVPPKH